MWGIAPLRNGLPLAGLERDHINVRAVVVACHRGPSEQDRLAAWQNLRPAVGSFAGVKPGHRHRRPAGGRDSRKSAALLQCRDDIAIVAPACTPSAVRVAQRDRRAAFHRNLLELAFREEPDPITGGRKEREPGVVRAQQWRDLALIKQSGVEAYFAVLAAQRERQAGAVGRKGDHVCTVGTDAALANGVCCPVSTFRRINGRRGAGLVALYQPAPATMATMSASVAIPATNQSALPNRGCEGAAFSSSGGGVFSSITTSRIDCQRSSGSFAKHRRTNLSSHEGVKAFTAMGAG